MYLPTFHKSQINSLITDTINRNSLPFFKKELEAIFALFDPDGVFEKN